MTALRHSGFACFGSDGPTPGVHGAALIFSSRQKSAHYSLHPPTGPLATEKRRDFGRTDGSTVVNRAASLRLHPQTAMQATDSDGLAEHSWARDIHGTLGLQRDIAILAALARNRAHGTDGPARQAHLEMERQQYILGMLRLPRHVPGLHNLRGMEANMEGLGTSPSEYLP
jgi:hypothetical protein